MKSKECFKCKKIKPFTQFYKHPAMADGIVGKCKECNKKDVHKNRADRLDYYQEYDRKRSDLPKRVRGRNKVAARWKKDPKLRAITNARSIIWRRKNKIKRAAHLLVQYEVKKGLLIKKPCEVCGKKKAVAHHDDYNKPLDVRWLCHKHHMQHHKEERERLRQLLTNRSR